MLPSISNTSTRMPRCSCIHRPCPRTLSSTYRNSVGFSFKAANLDCTAGAVELRNEIGRVLGVDLPGTLIFDYPTISAMSAMLAAKLAPKLAPKQTEALPEPLSR